jgi:tetratricopeptide (TPR) repeat protein
MASDWQIGDKIEDRWEIYKVLKGGMGVVYVVYDHDWKAALAAKTFQDEVFAQNPAIAGLFNREASTWIELEVHQNVTHARLIHDINGKPFLFLEYVSGGDLSSWIGIPRLTSDLAQVLRFGIQFCDGMIHALSKGIKAHRDIKPQNCLITKDNVLKVTDFGLAKIFDEPSSQSRVQSPSRNHISNMLVSRTGSAAGTPPYMAPEQFDDAKYVDVRSDIYSFGIMLFQMLEGRLPFLATTWSDIERLHKTKPSPPMQTKCSSLVAVVEHCLGKRPEQRFESFEVVRETLGQIFQEVTGQSAPLPAAGRKLEARELINKGISLAELGQHREAILCYDQSIALKPDYADTYNNKGISLHLLDQNVEALRCYDQAIALRPDEAKAQMNKGNCLYRLRQTEEALQCYDRAIALQPDDPKAYENKANLLDELLGQKEEAIKCYDRAIALQPNHAATHYNKGLCLQALGRHEEAILCYDRAIGLRPNHASTYSNKGFSLRVLSQYEEAIRCCDRAIALRPDLVSAHRNKGLCLYALGQYEAALPCLDRAVALRGEDPDAHFDMGRVFEALGRFQEALIAYQYADACSYAFGNEDGEAAKRIEAIRQKLALGG